MNLYELTSRYQSLLNYAQSIDFTDEDQVETFQTTFDSLDGAIEDKAEGIAHVLKQLEYDELIVNEEIKRYQAKKKVLVNNQKSLKRYLQESMEYMNKDKIKTPKFSINIQNNPPKLVVEDESEIPKAYWREQAPKLDRRKLLDDLRAGEEVTGAVLTQSRGVRFR